MLTDQEIEDRHTIASIINECLRDGYCNASHLARRITQQGIGNKKQAVKEFCEKLKYKLSSDKCSDYIPFIVYDWIAELFTELYGDEDND